MDDVNAIEGGSGKQAAHSDVRINSNVAVGNEEDEDVNWDDQGSTRTMKLRDTAAATQGLVSESGIEFDEERSIEQTAAEVGRLEDKLGRVRKSRMGGVEDRPPRSRPANHARLHGSPQDGDALLDLGQELVRREPKQLNP